MFLPAFEDLLKPQWLLVLKILKSAGGMPVSEISKKSGVNYMSLKQQCEALVKKGYLDRSRLPKQQIGRPEIFYKLSEKAKALFPGPPAALCLDLLRLCQNLYGETAPERLLFQYLCEKEIEWSARVNMSLPLAERAHKFAKLLASEGILVEVVENEDVLILRELHHPLSEIFSEFGRIATMYQKTMEAVIGNSLRKEIIRDAGDTIRWIDFLAEKEEA